jgi:chitobiase/beta-hexosaminidase-like protein
MKKSYIPAVIMMTTALAACGGTDFEWFPRVVDTTPPVVLATISNTTFQNNSSAATVHASPLPATVTFSVNEPATIYYTTNGTDPSTTSPSLEFSSTPVQGPEIPVTRTILKFFGIDKSTSQNKSTTKTITIVSP